MPLTPRHRAWPSVAGITAASIEAACETPSHHFATAQGDRFTQHDFSEGWGGLPLLAGALASFECQLDRTIDGGDHLLFIVRVMRIRWFDGQPLVFSAGRYCSTQALPSAGIQADVDAVWHGLG